MPTQRPKAVWLTYSWPTDAEDPSIGAVEPSETTARRSLDDLPDGWRVVQLPFGVPVQVVLERDRARRAEAQEQLELPPEFTDAVTPKPARRAAKKAAAAKPSEAVEG